MVNKVFIDTSGWISAIFKKDINHKTAVNYYLELEKCRNPVITSNYVISETLTWLNYNNNHNNALIYLDLLKKAEENNFLNVYWINKEITDIALTVYKKYSDQKLSFTDCTTYAICKKQNIYKVFGFDKHFNTLGLLLSPNQIHEPKTEYIK